MKNESLINEKNIRFNKLKIHSGDCIWKMDQLGILIDMIDFECDEEENAKLSYKNPMLIECVHDKD